MKVVVQFSVREEERALPFLLRHSPGTILPERVYVISVDAVRALREAGVRFAELGGDVNAPRLEGAGSGERV